MGQEQWRGTPEVLQGAGWWVLSMAQSPPTVGTFCQAVADGRGLWSPTLVGKLR